MTLAGGAGRISAMRTPTLPRLILITALAVVILRASELAQAAPATQPTTQPATITDPYEPLKAVPAEMVPAAGQPWQRSDAKKINAWLAENYVGRTIDYPLKYRGVAQQLGKTMFAGDHEEKVALLQARVGRVEVTSWLPLEQLPAAQAFIKSKGLASLTNARIKRIKINEPDGQINPGMVVYIDVDADSIAAATPESVPAPNTKKVDPKK